ncbi:hypothetical protein [Neptunomonas concharum]|uniref:Uncharacterized protein n=1 Tax=Neptunomonas concharum TaxID=1031538 RepID=A0A5P1R9I4_9GAMM|nr:hypothetical protein [Neptunomonas concharum]QEQ96263.1 hypothetical protein F0U83_05825 [Neptunomonas concharum]
MSTIKNPENMLGIAVTSVHDAAAAHNYVRHLVNRNCKAGPMYIYLSREQIEGARLWFAGQGVSGKQEQEKERNV